MSRSRSRSKGHVFVTVGTTKFDALIAAVNSAAVAEAAAAAGASGVVVQVGGYGEAMDELAARCDGLGIGCEVYNYKPSLQEDMAGAGWVIGHAGAGTVTEVLRMGKPMVAVANGSLMNNHQEELAAAMAGAGYVIRAEPEPQSLAAALAALSDGSAELQPFPPPASEAFVAVLDAEMGFVP
ncbi:UDP-N-acetyl glucosamine transferase subunit alg13 [Thecamonas trahens ATCC 50062]|uniref:UDP-N-acetylglucosamine transferase subunit ALG13 n=1 Tax=Thecamonas trahens ATCC 50062 TaxID=461836 RepID=A0A0L0DB70_THETB|nr:UDP-N-acetyl glucosamine transferase subunit alg13 [Thecamonas trahens ATCC 50062]KNC48553.1 UDP-N-acetyl glucosamine transferase subunit alg13 [Thecamonas trahens ATCC 50062]|eukprot:XP_013762610.1 UDP-N-acetyl glucosamine transferase subunit alg13 [Thecamonas trahens ATCC 50062]